MAHNTNEDNRSNLVKKMFYKDNNNAPLEGLRAKSRQNPSHENNNNFKTMPESVQRILDDKKEQLDKAMKHYSMELTKIN